MVENYYNEPRRPEKKSGRKLFDWQDHPGQGKGPGSDSIEDGEQTRTRLATEASGAGVRAKGTGDGGDGSPMGSIAQFVGETWNAGVNAASGIDAQKKFVDNVSPAVAQEFKRGKELAEGGYTSPEQASVLKEDDRKALEVYKRINGDMVASIPLYEQNALRRDVEQGILAKAREAENRTEKTDSPPTPPAADRVTAPAPNVAVDHNGAFKDAPLKLVDGAMEKVEPRSGGAQTEARPAWLAKGQENNALFALKPNSISATQTKAADTKMVPQAPEMRSTLTTAAPHNGKSDSASKPSPLDLQVEKAGQDLRFSQEPARKADLPAGGQQLVQTRLLQAVDTKSQGGRGSEHEIDPVQTRESRPAEPKPLNRPVAPAEARNIKVDEFVVSDRRMKALPVSDSQTAAQQSIERPGGQLRSAAQTIQSRGAGGPVCESERPLGRKVDPESKEHGNAPAARPAERHSEFSATAPHAGQDSRQETPIRRTESAGAAQPRAEGEPRTLFTFKNNAPIGSAEQSEPHTAKSAKETPLAIVSRSERQNPVLVTPADSGQPERWPKSFAAVLRIHSDTGAVESLKSAQVERAKEPGVPARVVYARVASAAPSAAGDVRVGKSERVERIPGLSSPEAKPLATARSTNFDTAALRNTVASNDVSRSNTRIGPAADGVRTASKAPSTRGDLPVRGVANPITSGDGSKPWAVRDIRITALPQNMITDKRYITGTEIALAAVIAAAGAARVRSEAQAGRPGSLPGADQNQSAPATSGIGSRRPEQTMIRHAEVPDHVRASAGTVGSGAPVGTADSSVPPATDAIPAVAGEQVQLPDAHVRIDAPDSIAELVAVLPSLEIVDDDQGAHVRPFLVSRPEGCEHDPAYVTAAGARSDHDGFAPHPVLRRPTTLISSGDTFVSIAEAFFNDSNLGWLIADLNRDRTSESRINGRRVVEIRSRQQIELPVWQDIVDFYRRRPLDAIPENVVTIVQESRLDAELLSARLGTVMGFVGPRAQQCQQSILLRSAPQNSFQPPFKPGGK